MSRSLRLLGILLPAAVFCTIVTAQLAPRRSPGRNFPPEIMLDRFIDVTTVAPRFFTAEMENSAVRVLRARLDGDARIPLHDARSGLIVAVTDVHLRLTTPDKKSQDIHVKAGQTHWIDGDTFSGQNLSSSPCEFLFVETLREARAVSDR